MNGSACPGNALSARLPQVPECPICMEAFDSSQRSVTVTDCRHIFDAHCLAVWQSHKPTCPICSTALPDRTITAVPECAICLSELFVPPREVSLTGCQHRFHTQCLHDSWVISPDCPDCHAPLSGSAIVPVAVDPLTPVSLEKCSMCMNVLDRRAELVSTACHHMFHRNCLAQMPGCECPLCHELDLSSCEHSDGFQQSMEVVAEMVENFVFY